MVESNAIFVLVCPVSKLVVFKEATRVVSDYQDLLTNPSVIVMFHGKCMIISES